MKIKKIYLIYTLIPFLLLSLLSMVANGEEFEFEFEQATAEEFAFYKKIRDRIDNKFIPYNITEILMSFVGVKLIFNCQPNTKFDYVYVEFNTELIHWDENIAKKICSEETVACYITDYDKETGTDKNGKRVKLLYFNNKLMLNTSYMKSIENTSYGKLKNEAILYHEYLHGQYLIDAMDPKSGDINWQTNICNCSDPDLTIIGHNNPSRHSNITYVEGKYVEANGKINSNVELRHEEMVTERNFYVHIYLTDEDLIKIDKLFNKNIDAFYYPITDNIVIKSFNYDISPKDPIKNRYMYYAIDGTIVSGTEGKLKFIVDPEEFIVIDYITIKYVEDIEGSTNSSIFYYIGTSLNRGFIIILMIFMIIIGISRIGKNKK